MNLLDPVEKIMSRNLVVIAEEEPLLHVEKIFEHHNIHHIPVVKNSKLIGIVSKSDFLFFKRGFNDHSTDVRIDLFRLKTHIVKDIMTTGVATLNFDERINVALEIFKENLFHAIPIMDENKLVGILSTYDIINRLAEDREATNTYK